MSTALFTIVNAWCAKERRATKAWPCAVAAAAVIAGFAWAGTQGLLWAPWAFVYMVVTMLVWYVAAPPLWILVFMPVGSALADDLLSMIAASDEIPESLKEYLAARAAVNGVVTFDDLDAAVHHAMVAESTKRRRCAPGFQAILSCQRSGATSAAPDQAA